MKSTHLPEVAGDIVTFTGSLVIDLAALGVRECQAYDAHLAQAPAAGAAYLASVLSDDKKKLTITAYDSAYAVAAIATKVSWHAFGK